MAGFFLFILLTIKDYLLTLVKYFKFRANKYVSIGKLVEVNDFAGRIKDIQTDHIIIEGEKGYYRIPMERWQFQKWFFLRSEIKETTDYDGKRLGLRKNDDIKIDRKSPEYKELLKKIQGEKDKENKKDEANSD